MKKLIYVLFCCDNLRPLTTNSPEMSTSPQPPSYNARSAGFRICGSDPTIPGIHIGCGKSFQPENDTIKVCTDCADLADRIVTRIEQAAEKRKAQNAPVSVAKRRKPLAFDALYGMLD